MEVYKDKDTTHIVAIGELKTASNGTNKSCLVMLDDKNNPAFNYYIRTSQTSSNVLFERFSDIVVTDNYVATVSFVSFAEKFLIRRCDLHTPENPLLQKCFLYEFPNYTGFILALSGTLRTCKMTGNLIAVGTSAGEVDNPSLERYFVFLNYISLDAMSIEYSNEIKRQNKMNDILKMAYSEETGQLLMLENWDMYNQGTFLQSVTHIFPTYTQNYYTTLTDFLSADYIVNDMNITALGNYFTIGSNYSQGGNLFIYTQGITNDAWCGLTEPQYVKYTCNSLSYQVQDLQLYPIIFPMPWTTNNVQVNTYQWNIDCNQ